MRLSLLAEATIQTIERYYLAIALLLQAGSGAIGQEALEERCHLMAQRMSVLYGLNSPGVLRQEPVPEFHRAAAAPRNVVQTAGRQAVVRRAAARRWGGRATGAVGADQAQHPAGHPGAVSFTPSAVPADRCPAWWSPRRFFESMRRSLEALVGRVFLRIFGSISAAESVRARRSSASRRFCSWLRSLRARDQDGAVVD
jgi:hypothetical protein